jgi:hypothetical protein
MVLTKTECLFKGLPIKDYDPWTVDEERYLTGLITDKMPGGRGIESTINWSLVATQMNTDAPIYHLSMRKYTAKIVKDHYCAVIGPRAHVEEQKEKRDKVREPAQKGNKSCPYIFYLE